MTPYDSMIVFDFANRVFDYDRNSDILSIERELIDKHFILPTEWDTLYPIQKWGIENGRYANMGWQQQLNLYNLTVSDYLSGKSVCRKIQKELLDKSFLNLMRGTNLVLSFGDG